MSISNAPDHTAHIESRRLRVTTADSLQNRGLRVQSLAWDQIADLMASPKRADISRAAFMDLDRKQQTRIKDVGWIVGGPFEPAIRKKGNLKFREFVALDADNLSPTDIEIIRSAYLGRSLTFVLHSTFKHCSSQPRLRLIFPLARRIESESEYEAVSREIASWSGSELFDERTHEFSRVMFFPAHPRDVKPLYESHDGAWINPDEVLAGIQSNSVDQWRTTHLSDTDDKIRVNDTLELNYAPYALPYLEAAMEYLEADDYNEWLQVGMALHAETRGADDGLALWDEWSGKSGKYEDRACEEKWESFGNRKDEVRGGSIVRRARKAGFDPELYTGVKRDFTVDLAIEGAKITMNSSAQSRGESPSISRRFPKHLLDVPGLVGEIADYTLQIGHRNQPLFGIAAGLAAVSAATQNRFEVVPWGTRLNLYLLVVAMTGEGKESPRTAIKRSLRETGHHQSIIEAASSGPALLRAVSRSNRHAALLLQDEIGRLLSVAGRPSNGHLYELVSEIIRLYGLSSSMHAGKVYADTKNNISPIQAPYLTVFGTTTKRSLVDALSNRDVLDGTLNRFLMVDIDSSAEFKEPNQEMGETLKQSLRNLDCLGLADFLDEHPKEITRIMLDNEATKLLIDFRDHADTRRTRNEAVGPLWARAFENALRVAGVVAVGLRASEGTLLASEPVVTTRVARWSIEFTEWCVGRLVQLAEREVADNEFHRAVRQIRGYIIERCLPPSNSAQLKTADQWRAGLVTKSEITRKFQNIDSRMRAQALQTLLESEEVQVVQKEGSKTTYFRPMPGSDS